MNLKDKWESLFPETQKKIIQWIAYPLLFLILITPSIIWFSIPNNYATKNDWLQDFAWAFPTTIFGAAFITIVTLLIVNYIRDTKK